MFEHDLKACLSCKQEDNHWCDIEPDDMLRPLQVEGNVLFTADPVSGPALQFLYSR